MMRVRVTYVSRTSAARGEAKAKAAGLVAWAAAALDADVRQQIEVVDAVDTGNMLNSVGHAMQGPTRAMVYVGADYAHYVHDGTSKMAGRPFFTQAIEIFRPVFDARVRSL
jgi:hypothetical protein